MKINPLLNEIARGLWFMDIQSLETWGVFAHRILSNEKLNLPELQSEPKALISFFDDKNEKQKPDENGNIRLKKDSVAVVDRIGPLVKYGDWCTYGADDIYNVLTKANNDDNISAIVVNDDGPGGSVSSIAPFVQFGKEKRKPVVVLYDQMCSAHLYSAYAMADYVIAANDISATIGSIGVVLSFADNRKYLESKGYTFHDIYPKESEHKNQAFMLALEGKYDMIKDEMLSPLAKKFQDDVKLFRPQLKHQETGVLTGKTFLAKDAIDLGFADAIGDLKFAIEKARIISELKNNYKP
jgi:protease-4